MLENWQERTDSFSFYQQLFFRNINIPLSDHIKYDEIKVNP